MRIPRSSVLLLALSLAASGGARAGELKLYDQWHPDPWGILKMVKMGGGRGYRAAADSALAGLTWLRLGARWEARQWARGETIALTLKDGRELEAGPVWGMTGPTNPPPGDRIELGLQTRLIRRADLDPGSWGRGGLILAGFRAPVEVKDVASVTIRQRRF